MTLLVATQVVVTTAGARIVTASSAGQQILVTNRDSSLSVFFGPAGVTSTSGAEIKPGTSLSNSFIDLPPETECWLVAASGTPRTDVTQIEAN